MVANFRNKEMEEIEGRLEDQISKEQGMLARLKLKDNNNIEISDKEWDDMLREVGKAMVLTNKLNKKRGKTLTEDEKKIARLADLQSL